MKLIKRVFVSVLRRKSASLIILLATFLLGNVLAVSLSIEQSSLNVKENLMNSIGGKMTLSSLVTNYSEVEMMNDQKYEEEMNAFYKVYTRLINRDYIKYSDFNLHYPNIKSVDDIQFPASTSREMFSLLHGVNNEKLVDELEGIITIIDGERFTSEQIENGEHVILVSNKVKINGESVKVGDTLRFSTYADGYNWNTSESYSVESEPVEYKVIGIYQGVENKYSDVQKEVYPFYVPNNCIVELYKENIKIRDKSQYKDFYDTKMWVSSVLIHVNSPEKIDELIYAAEVYIEKKICNFSYETTEHYVSQLIGPINSFADIAGNVVIFSLVFMCAIVGLISFYFIRDRKYEIGIYMALGIKRFELINQIILEILFVGFIGLSLSSMSGYAVSQFTADYLLDVTIQTSNEEKDKYTTGMTMIDPNNIQQEDILNQYEIIITVEDISNLYILGICTLIVSSIFPLVYILQIKPKNVLLE